VLGRYLQCPPHELDFDYGAWGKPRLAGDHAGQLRFSLSHSADLTLCAVAREGEVGVDVERLRADPFVLADTRHCFSRRELATLDALPPADQFAAFFASWTIKEACLKADGRGMAAGMHRVEVPAGSVSSPPAAEECATRVDRWQVTRLLPMPGYCGAVASRFEHRTSLFSLDLGT
jgi:4'-phosphopantetheinyl transferase